MCVLANLENVSIIIIIIIIIILPSVAYGPEG